MLNDSIIKYEFLRGVLGQMRSADKKKKKFRNPWTNESFRMKLGMCINKVIFMLGSSHHYSEGMIKLSQA